MSADNILPSTKERKQDLRQELARYHLSPSKKMRQNFLVGTKAIRQLIDASQINKEDTIIEIGAGTGILTKIIAQKAKTVIAIEKDRGFSQLLKKKLDGYNNVKLIQEDILNLDFQRLRLRNYKVVANLPFDITFEVIKRFLTTTHPPRVLILIIQKEVGEKICSKKKNNFWSLFIKLYARAQIITSVQSSSFWPQPKVKTVIIKIEPQKKGIGKENKEEMIKFIKIGFRQPRKKLINNLKEGLQIKKKTLEKLFKKSDIPLQKRAEGLSLEEWKNLFVVYSKFISKK